MYVDLFGLPGGGKTTIMNGLVKECRYLPVAMPNVKKEFHRLRFVGGMLFHPWILFVMLFRLLTRPHLLVKVWRAPSQYYGPFIDFYLAWYCALEARRNLNNVYVSQHGFVQTLVQSRVLRQELAMDEYFLSLLVRGFPKGEGYKYVYVLVSAKEARRRRMKGVQYKQYDEYREGRKIFNVVKEMLNVPVINGENMPGMVLQEVKHVITK